MFSLRGRQDGFRLLLPKEFLCDEITEKYSNILQSKHSYIYSPIDFLNETIKSVQVLGFSNATIEQMQPGYGTSAANASRIPQNKFSHTASGMNYRSETNPVNLIDKTLNIEFRHTLGYVNYFMLFENFFWQYERDTKYEELIPNLFVDILDGAGNIYSRIEIMKPIINGIDMLDFNYDQPVAQSQTFKVEFKYSNIDFQFIDDETSREIITYI